MVTKKVYCNDLEWGDCKGRKICGDMGFSFCDQADTRTEDFEELRRGTEEYCMGDAAVKNCETLEESGNGSFAIYSVCEETIILDEEDEPICSGSWIERRPLYVYVCATKEQAGWIEETGYYDGVKIKYREK